MPLHDIPGDNVFHIPVPAATANAASADTAVWSAPFKLKITAVDFIPLAAVTGTDSDSRTLALKNGSNVVASTAFTNGINATAKTAKSMTLSGTAANLLCAAGDVLAVNSALVGTNGLALPAGMLRITCQGN